MNEEFDRFEEHMANEELEPYEVFAKHMEEKYPAMFSQPYGGFAVGEGWWPILESLCGQIQHHIDWKNKQSVIVAQVTVAQIKEKFGGLRFYIYGGDEYIRGMIAFAESMSYKTCESCGNPGKVGGKGWITTLCVPCREEKDKKEAEWRKNV